MPIQRCPRNSADEPGAAMRATYARRWRACLSLELATATVLATTASAALAQSAAPDQVSLSASLTGIGQLEARLDQGGNFSWNGVIVQGAATRQFTPEFSAGISLRYGYESWQFDTPSALGAVAPWGTSTGRQSDSGSRNRSVRSSVSSSLPSSSGATSRVPARAMRKTSARSLAPPGSFRRRSCSASARGLSPDRQDACLSASHRQLADRRPVARGAIRSRPGRRAAQGSSWCVRSARNGSSPPVPPFATIGSACATTARPPTASAATRASRVRPADTTARAARSHRSLCRGGHRRETARARFQRGDAVVVELSPGAAVRSVGDA